MRIDRAIDRYRADLARRGTLRGRCGTYDEPARSAAARPRLVDLPDVASVTADDCRTHLDTWRNVGAGHDATTRGQF